MATAVAPTNTVWDWQKRLAHLEKRCGALENDPEGSEYDEDLYDDEDDEDAMVNILCDACKVVLKAHMTEHADKDAILERADALISRGVKSASKRQLGRFYMKSFVHRPGTLVKDSMHSFMGHSNGQLRAVDS